MSKASSERGKSSHRTDDGCEKGEHWIDGENRMSKASSERGKSSHRTDDECENGEHWIDEEKGCGKGIRIFGSISRTF
jgi:hypothetical protein